MILRLRPTRDRSGWADELIAQSGRQVGLAGVLGHLTEEAEHLNVPAKAAAYGFGWSRMDSHDDEWWPQGISTSGEATEGGVVQGRQVVLVSWYARPQGERPSRGSRISVVDVTVMTAPRYQHVLLVEPVRDEERNALAWKPVTVHAGGIVWYDDMLFVADTNRGLRTFSLRRLTRLTEPIGGFRYVLPQHGAYRQDPDDGVEPFRFSFVSADRSGTEHSLVVGEYGTAGATTRIAAVDVRPGGDLRLTDGAAQARTLPDLVGHTQGVCIVDGTVYASVSRGPRRRGTMMARAAGGDWVANRSSLSVGPEDLTYWPQRDQIWTVGEHPGHRYVYAMPRHRFRVTPHRFGWFR